MPLLERVEVLLDLRREPGRVLHGPRRRAHRPGGRRGSAIRSPDGRTPQRDAGRDPRARGRARRRAVAPLVEARAAACARRGGHRRSARSTTATPAELEELARRFERRDLSRADAARRRAGPAVPVHLGRSRSASASSCATPRPGEERFARVKVPEGLPRFLELGERGAAIPLERVIAHFLSALFPQMEIVECAVFRVTRDADFEVSDEADDLLEAVELELRRRRFGERRPARGLAMRCRAGCSSGSRPGCGVDDGAGLPRPRACSTWPTLDPARGARAARPEGRARWLGRDADRASPAGERATRSSTRSAAATCSSTTRTTRSRRRSRRSCAQPPRTRT